MKQNGTCSAVAAQLLLSYNNYYNDRRIISNCYLFDGEDGPNTCTNPLSMTNKILGTRGLKEDGSDETNSYFHKIVEKIPASSSASQIRTGMDSLLYERKNELGINIDLAKVSYGTDLSMIKSEIDANRPIIVSMRETDGNHAVVCYGYQTLGGSGTDQDGQFGYIVHYGWTDEKWKNVWINKNWCFNWVKMEVPHTHSYGNTSGLYYESVCTVCGHRTSDYPFTTVSSNNQVSIIGADFVAPDDFVIPAVIDGNSVTSISAYAFSGQDNIKKLKIPSSIQMIGEGAFSGCNNLEKITLPFIGESRTASGSKSYFGYVFGTSSYIGSTLTNQSGTDYYIPTTLHYVKITDETSVKAHSFENCSSLYEISLPYGVTNIGDYAFSGCSRLSSFEIPRTVSTIGDSAFLGCNQLISLTIPYKVASIGINAFPTGVDIIWIYNPSYTASSLGITNCLTRVKVQSGVKNVVPGAFANCNELEYVYIYMKMFQRLDLMLL